MSTPEKVLLVSASPRRRELLAMIEVQFDVYNADIDETRQEWEEPESYAMRMAREKAMTGIRMRGNGLPALGADTIVLLDDAVMGKPADRDKAEAMLSRLSGRRHQVITAVALARDEQLMDDCLHRSWVDFDAIPEDWIKHYAKQDEPMDKAGAYAVQGLAAQWIRRIEGSFSGIMGLPLFETSQLLRAAGFSLSGRGV